MSYFRILVFLNAMLWGTINSQLTSTVMDLAPLMKTYQYVVEHLDVVVDEKRKALCFVKDEINRYEREYNEAKMNLTAYIENPISKYTFLKRMSTDLDWLETIINKPGRIHKDKSVYFPTFADMDRASMRLQLLQSVYRLSVTQLADGLLHTRYGPDRKYYTEHFSPMTVEECYDIGRLLYVVGAMKEGVSWMLEAYRRLDKHRSITLTKSKLIWAICQGYNALDDNLNFIDWAEKLTAMNTLSKDFQADLHVKTDIHRLRMSQKEWNEKQAMYPDVENKHEEDEKKEVKKDLRKLRCISEAETTDEYSILCRGESLIDPEMAKRLTCWYFSGRHPYMRLGPVKIEQLHMQPNVFMIHQAITDNEIEHMRGLAELQLQFKKNKTSSTNKNVVSGKVVFLRKSLNILDRVTRRVEDLSGLKQNWSDTWQVNHYGVGGHCVMHHDYYLHIRDPRANNKLASVIFYLSNVVQGGATVFYNLGLTVYPVKGAALFWKNLRATGEGNNMLCHGACPVLRGSKWLATMWMYRHNQKRQICRRTNKVEE